MIARAVMWWAGRSPRERWLVGVMVAVVGVFLLWFGVVAPLNAVRARAAVRLTLATAAAGDVALTADRIAAARRLPVPVLAGGLTDTIGTAATAAGFTLSRLDLQGQGRAAFGISSARSPALFGLLNELGARGIIVERLTLRSNSDATLAVDGVLRTRMR